MTDDQSRIHRMGKAVLGILDAFKTAWEKIKNFVEKHDELAASLAAIEELDKEQGTDLTGIAKTKKTKKTAMANSATEVAKVLTAYARSINDEKLLAEVDLEQTDFAQSKDKDALDRSGKILELAEKYANEAADSGLTEDMRKQLKADIDAFAKLFSSPKEAIAKRKTITKELDDALDAMVEKILVPIDEMMAPFKSKNNKFYSDYFNARNIDDSGKRSTALMVKIEQNKVRIKGALVEVIHPNGTIVKKLSTVRGIAKFMDSELEAAVYTVRISKAGYETQTIKGVSVKEEGVKMKRLNVELKAV